MTDLNQLTPHFTLSEMCRTATGLPNAPDMTTRQRLFELCQYILEPIRDHFGPVVIHCGYRSPAVNEADGGKVTSQHLKGEAADFHCGMNLREVFLWIHDNLHYGQVILESKERIDGSVAHWIHVSLPRWNKPNMDTLISVNGQYRKFDPTKDRT